MKIKLFEKYTRLYNRNKKALNTGAFILINQGGSRSSKTYTALQIIIKNAIEDPGSVTTVVGQDFPNLASGAMRDFKTLIGESDLLPDFFTNPTAIRGPFRLRNSSMIEFKSYDDEQDAKSGTRDYLFANEADGIPWAIFNQLLLRTKKLVIVDYNPTSKFWAHTKLMQRKDAVRIISTYKDNLYAPKKTVEQLLEWKQKWLETGDPYYENLWKVYGLGQTGAIEGTVFPDVTWIDQIPSGLFSGYGIDFGFSNDPTAIGYNAVAGKKLYSQKLVYEYAMTADDIHQALIDNRVDRRKLIIADSSNLTDIATLFKKGWNILPAVKPPNSRAAGVQAMKNYDLHLVDDYEGDYKHEQENYIWKTDKRKGLKLNEPEKHDDHLFDQLRYWITFVTLPIKEQKMHFRKMKKRLRKRRKRNRNEDN